MTPEPGAPPKTVDQKKPGVFFRVVAAVVGVLLSRDTTIDLRKKGDGEKK